MTESSSPQNSGPQNSGKPAVRRIEPRTLKGFRDFTPDMMIPRETLIDRVKRVYRGYGFSPIDTPVLEYLDILTGKGSDVTDKQLYRFTDSGGRQVGMRFDLTVPFARFSAQHIGRLGTPFKRYHIAKVWRGENTQAGRYREFMQCDFDTIGTTSVLSDAETALVINDILQQVNLKSDEPFTDFTVHLNSRKILTGLLEKIGLADKTIPVLRALDKLAKIGPEKVAEEMISQGGATEAQAASILELASICEGTSAEKLAALEKLLAGNDRGLEGVQDLKTIFEIAAASGVPEGRFTVDLTIARGLDYYTATVFETFLNKLPQLGSVASGGRYDNLAELYTSEKLPGVGASLGLDRLFAGLEELAMLPETFSAVKVFIPLFDPALAADYFAIAAELRRAGIGAELYPEPKKLGAQLKYADRRGFTAALICGEDEKARGAVVVKNLKTREQTEVAVSHLAEALKGL
ncbi:MAG: histidine--tRNA ligase [Thermoguttaceae bacterium]|nr:histidine--tRNA ligase [Thermoguttaceae bacterium]